MIDPLLSLAFNIQSNKGVYSVLVGSGLSSSAGILTGRGIILDLSRKLAAMMGEDPTDEPEKWYAIKFGKDPSYSELLEALCKTSTERQQLLRSYFEPTEDERTQGLKQPTKAHRAIAKLVSGGFIRIILTTNFDRLLEMAIQEEGVSPVVVASADAAAGSIPLAHQKCCVIKLHGDYYDTRILNTPDELAKYDPRMNKLLDQVLDDFGMIACGWSGQWDVALRAAFERCASRRFTTFWAAHGSLKEEAKQLINLRSGLQLPIADADSFFWKLNDTVQALDKLNTPHPSSLSALAGLTTRYLADPKLAISLSDLVHDEVEAIRPKVKDAAERVIRVHHQIDMEPVFSEIRNIAAKLQIILIHGAAFGKPEHDKLWIDAIQRVSSWDQFFGVPLDRGIQLYHSVVLLFSAGLAMANDRLDLAVTLLLKPQCQETYRGQTPLLLSDVWERMASYCDKLTVARNTYSKRSEHLYVVLREPLKRYLPDDFVYDQVFDRWEYILAVAYMDLQPERESQLYWAPVGRFFFSTFHSGQSIVIEMGQQLKELGERWPLLHVGLFGGKLERAMLVHERLAKFINSRAY